MKKQIGFLLMALLLIAALAFIGCPTDNSDGGEDNKDSEIPSTLTLGSTYTGKISGTIGADTNEGYRYEKTYSISGATFNEGDFIKVSFTIGEGAAKFKQVNIAVNLDAYGYKGSRDGSWGNTAAGVQRESYIQTVKTWKDAQDNLTTNQADGVTAIELPQAAKLRIRFKTGGGTNQTGFETGEAVSVFINDLKVEKVNVAQVTVSFKPNGGAESDTAVQLYNAPDYNIIPETSIPQFTKSGYSLVGWGPASTSTAAQKVDLSAPVTANGELYAIWGDPAQTLKGELTEGTERGLNQFAIPLSWLGDGSNGSELEIEITAPEKSGDGQATGYYPGDGWGCGALLDGVDGWGESLGTAFALNTPNPGPVTVDGKKTFSLKFSVGSILDAIQGKTTEALKINAYNGLGGDTSVNAISAKFYLITY